MPQFTLSTAALRRASAALVAALLLGGSSSAAARVVYSPSAASDAVYAASAGTDGVLGSGTGLAISDHPSSIVVSSDGGHAYVARSGLGMVSTYVTGASGSLGFAGSAPAGANPVALAMTPDGSMLFSADAAGGVSGFDVGADGSLTNPLGAGVALPSTVPAGVAISADGKHLLVVEGATGKLASFGIGSGAQLTAEAQASTGAGPSGVAVTPDGQRAYVANAAGSISGFSVSNDGSLSELQGSPYPAVSGAQGIAISRDGSQLVVAAGSSNAVRSYLIGVTGAIVAEGTTQTLPGARAVAISPSGATAFVGGNGIIRAYALGGAGLSVSGADVATLGQQDAIAVVPDMAPTAVIDSAPAYAGSATPFEGGHSNDSDGAPAQWSWNFGDGATASGQQPSHVYARPGTYTVTLTVTDNEGCSTAMAFTGQMASCVGSARARVSQAITIQDQPAPAQNEPPCIHDGNDGFCGTLDEKAPVVSLVGINDGASITTVDAPQEIAGFITPDPSGVKNVMLRFTRTAGFKTIKKLVRKKKCKRVHIKRRSKKTKLVCQKAKKKISKNTTTKKSTTISRIALCDTIADDKNYFIRKRCENVVFIPISGDTTFRYELPVALGLGTYSVEVYAVDTAGNQDVLEEGRNKLTFKIVKTPSNSGGGSVTAPTTTSPSTPINDTGSPFG